MSSMATMFPPIVPFPPLNNDGRDASNGFPAEDPAHFPNAAPIWGFNMNDQLPDIRVPDFRETVTSPVCDITPDDDNDLTAWVSKFYVGGAGDLKCTTDQGATITLHSLVAGVTYGFTFLIKRIFATGTTAAEIVGIV